jgi:hypothetical protein
MKPVEGAGERGDELNHEVLAGDVGQLVKEHDAPPLERPL